MMHYCMYQLFLTSLPFMWGRGSRQVLIMLRAWYTVTNVRI